MKINHYHFESIDSTNNWVKSHIEQLDKSALTFVSASFQAAGRGRFNRSWISPPNENLLASYVLWLGQFDFNLPQVLALLVSEMLNERGFDVRLKWPNDLVLNGKKLGGILSESIEQQTGRWMILGIGLNLNMDEETLALIDKPATSLFNESRKKFDPQEMGHLLAVWLEKSINAYHGFNPFYDRFVKKLLHQPGDFLKIGNFQGTFKEFNRDGSITLTLADGAHKVFISGEILS